MMSENPEFFGVVGFLVQVVILPLLGIVWKSINARMARLEKTVEVASTNNVTAADCIERHGHLCESVRLIVAPIEKKLDHMCNGGLLGKIQQELQDIDRRLSVIEHVFNVQNNQKKD
jgi:uncharacterized protein Smg (DUF494 family)